MKSTLEALERVNARLLLAGREDLALIRRLLAERGALVKLMEQAPAREIVRREPALVERLASAIEAGAELERRLLLLRSVTRAELKDLAREARLARALEEALETKLPRRVNLSG